ncbi:hypothetical protein BDW69DRAFT_51875 [Aspergillus filifer]
MPLSYRFSSGHLIPPARQQTIVLHCSLLITRCSSGTLAKFWLSVLFSLYVFLLSLPSILLLPFLLFTFFLFL